MQNFKYLQEWMNCAAFMDDILKLLTCNWKRDYKVCSLSSSGEDESFRLSFCVPFVLYQFDAWNSTEVVVALKMKTSICYSFPCCFIYHIFGALCISGLPTPSSQFIRLLLNFKHSVFSSGRGLWLELSSRGMNYISINMLIKQKAGHLQGLSRSFISPVLLIV